MEKTGCKIICGAPTTLAVKRLMMMMMMMMNQDSTQGRFTWRVQLQADKDQVGLTDLIQVADVTDPSSPLALDHHVVTQLNLQLGAGGAR